MYRPYLFPFQIFALPALFGSADAAVGVVLIDSEPFPDSNYSPLLPWDPQKSQSRIPNPYYYANPVNPSSLEEYRLLRRRIILWRKMRLDCFLLPNGMNLERSRVEN